MAIMTNKALEIKVIKFLRYLINSRIGGHQWSELAVLISCSWNIEILTNPILLKVTLNEKRNLYRRSLTQDGITSS